MSEANSGALIEKPRRPSLLAALCAPILGVVKVSRAASLLTRASPFQLALVLLIYLAMQASICVVMALWEDTLRYDYQFTTTLPASGGWQVESRSMAEVWSEWEVRPRGNPAVEIFMGVGFATLASVIVAIALFWPRVHRHGRLRPSLRRTQAAVSGTFGLAIVLTAIVFTVCILIRHWRMRYGLRWGNGPQEGQFTVLGVQLSILLMLRALGRAVHAASDANFAPDPPPMCEGCGYDLTHRPESGRCPECGTSVDKSLEQGMGRRPADFDKDPSLPDAIATSVDALFSPATFYRRLAVRIEPQQDALFRLRHHIAIFCGALIWVAILIYSNTSRGWGWDETTVVFAASLGAPIIGWLLQHVVGGIVCLVWAFRRTLPDLRWGVRVVNFETVYLWLFCTYNGVMITSFVMFDDWIGDLFGTWNQIFGVPNALLVMAMANLAMVGYWIVRLLRNGRGVQWANF